MSISNIMFPEAASVTGIDLINIPGFTELVLRFMLNSAVIFIMVRWLYYTTTRRKDYLFTYILISTAVFLLCFLLESVKLQLGFALGLFAVFGIIRYRTNSMPIREMTYLFLVIGISVINALTGSDVTVVDLLFSNLVIILITFVLEKVWLLKFESSKRIIYEKIELIKPARRSEMIQDLKERTGIEKISRIEIGKIDFLKDICEVTIFYNVTEPDNRQESFTEGNGKDDDD